MKIARITAVLFGLAITALCLSCAKNYVIIDEMKGPFITPSVCNIGAITDELPADFPPEDKPTAESIAELKQALEEALEKEKIFEAMESPSMPDYLLTGSILDYSKGSGFLRFMFGAFAGAAQVTISLKLIDTKRDEVVFGGNFKGAVTSWAEKGSQMYKNVSKDFAKALKKQIKKVAANK